MDRRIEGSPVGRASRRRTIAVWARGIGSRLLTFDAILGENADGGHAVTARPDSRAGDLPPTFDDRIAERDWDALEAELDTYGAALLEGLLTPDECLAIASL